MSGPVLNTITNGSQHIAVILEVSSNGQVTGGCLINTGTSKSRLDLTIPTQQPYSTDAGTTADGGLLLGTCRGLFSLYQKGPITVGAASSFGLDADAGIDGNSPRKINLAFSDTPGWSIEIAADGMFKAIP